jgi:hypothetical protein
LANGKTLQAECYRVGPLAHLLKNRFYIGEVAYRGEVHPGEHEAILDRDVFEAVQAKIREQTVERKLARSRSPHLLTGKLFDDRGNPMSPTHANKKGVRYRYYTSQALLQGRKDEAGSVTRVTAADVEHLTVDALITGEAANAPSPDRDLVDQHVIRATVRQDRIEVEFRSHSTGDTAPIIKSIPFAPFALPKKGYQHRPSASAGPTDTDRTAILAAIARSRAWVDVIFKDPNESFESIAAREGRSARYIKLLAPLAYVSPLLVEALAEGRPVANLTITTLAKALPLSWAEQERAYLLD